MHNKIIKLQTQKIGKKYVLVTSREKVLKKKKVMVIISLYALIIFYIIYIKIVDYD